MKKKTLEIQEKDLHAYVDKQLSAEKVAAVEALMQEDPEVAIKIHTWQQQNQAIKALYQQKEESEIPERLNLESIRQKIEAEKEDQIKKTTPWFYSMAASMLMMLSGAVGWYSHSLIQPTPTIPTTPNTTKFVNSAISAYQVYSSEKLHPVEVGADKQDHLVAWLSKRIDHPLTVPDLKSYGYDLLGGRLLSMAKGRPAAQFMFENKEGKRVTLLISKNPNYRNQEFHSKSDKKISAYYWMDANIAYSITSEISSEALRKLSKTVYKQLLGKQTKQLASL